MRGSERHAELQASRSGDPRQERIPVAEVVADAEAQVGRGVHRVPPREQVGVTHEQCQPGLGEDRPLGGDPQVPLDHEARDHIGAAGVVAGVEALEVQVGARAQRERVVRAVEDPVEQRYVDAEPRADRAVAPGVAVDVEPNTIRAIRFSSVLLGSVGVARR